jgi:nucleoid DNA-binding protein
MKKSDLIREVARQQGVAPGTAADQMDRAVSRLVRALREGRPARLPGLGTISPGKRWLFSEEPHER